MTWKKYFKTYDGMPVRSSDNRNTGEGNASSSKYSR